MKSKTQNKLDDKEKVIRLLFFLLLLVTALLVHAHIRVVNVPKEYTHYTPPDLSLGGATQSGKWHDVGVYNFSYMIWSHINTWEEDGSKEFETKLQGYRHYISPSFLQSKLAIAAKDKLSNRNRERRMEYVDKAWEAKHIGNNRWAVAFVVRVIDKINNTVLKDEYIRYYFLVVPENVPRDLNPWQYKIDSEFKQSHRVENPNA